MGLAVTDLSCSRAGRPVLDGLSFRLDDGGSLLLRGPNGAGKSTLLRALAGLLPAGGTIELDGAPLARDREAWSERVAYAGHLDAVKPQLTVAENLGFWADLLLGSEPVGPALAAFGLAGIADRPAQFCSAGQKRRLGLARLLLAPRRLWLLDEPTVALDEAGIACLLAAVRDLCARGGVAVIATHATLDLPGTGTLSLSPLDAARGSTADPFLAERWA